jgi:hypothetical protein
MRLAGHVAHFEDARNVYKVLVGVSEEKRSIGRPKRECELIKIDRKEMGWEGVDWIHLAQDTDQRRALMDTVIEFRVP